MPDEVRSSLAHQPPSSLRTDKVEVPIISQERVNILVLFEDRKQTPYFIAHADRDSYVLSKEVGEGFSGKKEREAKGVRLGMRKLIQILGYQESDLTYEILENGLIIDRGQLESLLSLGAQLIEVGNDVWVSAKGKWTEENYWSGERNLRRDAAKN